MREVLADKPFYAASGGGLTLTGGEPMFQADFATELAAAAAGEGVDVALDTCGEAPWERYEGILPYIGLFLYDVKATGADLHRRVTGVDGVRILDNLRRLDAAGAKIRLRCPIVPGVNDSQEHLEHVERLASELKGVVGVDRLPYHALGRGKYAKFGITEREMA